MLHLLWVPVRRLQSVFWCKECFFSHADSPPGTSTEVFPAYAAYFRVSPFQRGNPSSLNLKEQEKPPSWRPSLEPSPWEGV